MGLRSCPSDPTHGPLLAVVGVEGFWCPSQDHDGRPSSHPLGEAPRSRNRWRLDDLAALDVAR